MNTIVLLTKVTNNIQLSYKKLGELVIELFVLVLFYGELERKLSYLMIYQMI